MKLSLSNIPIRYEDSDSNQGDRLQLELCWINSLPRQLMIPGKRLLLLEVFQRVLEAYATKLFARLPKGGIGIVAAATSVDGQTKLCQWHLLDAPCFKHLLILWGFHYLMHYFAWMLMTLQKPWLPCN